MLFPDDKHKILCIAIPTCEPDVFMKYWINSLHYLEDAKDIITIAINFQKPWTDELIESAISQIEDMGFKYECCFNEYDIPSKGLVPICKIRNDTFELCPDSLFYVLTDDDFQYCGPSATAPKTAGQQYIDIVHYMLQNYDKCGMTIIGGSMIRKIPKNHIMPVPINTHVTNLKGIVIRNMRDYGFNMFPNDSLSLYGAGEERILAASRLWNNLYIAKMGFGRTHHYEVQKKSDVVNGIEMYEWDSKNIIDNNVNKYLRDHYNSVTGDTLHDGKIIDDTNYTGISQDEFESYLSIDYSKVNENDLLESIYKMSEAIMKGECYED